MRRAGWKYTRLNGCGIYTCATSDMRCQRVPGRRIWMVFHGHNLLEIVKTAKCAINVAEILISLGPDGRMEFANGSCE